jgi:type IV pilus assembly protein PilW
MKKMENRQGTRQKDGFTLVEVLIAMGLGGLLMTTVIGMFIAQRRSYETQEQIAEMVQTARAAMDMMCREVRMAGFNPTGASFQGIPYQANQLRIVADLRGPNPHDPPDGDTDDPNEEITYVYDAKNKQIDRNSGGGNQPFAENIEAFAFALLDVHGSPTVTSAEIRQVRVSITARTAKPDRSYAANGGYRTYTLACLVTPVNLSAGSL